MKKWRNLLSIGLFVQILLVVWANVAQTDYGTFKPQEPLLSFDPMAIDSIHLEQSESKALDMKKEGGRWYIEPLDKFQADQEKITDFLTKLGEVKKGWPVATTASAAKRFKVSPNEFEGKIVLAAAGKEVGALYAGTSPTFRKVHIRNEKEDSVYLVKIDSHSIDATPDNWIDTAILHQKEDHIVKVQLPRVTLLRKDGRLIVEDMDSTTEAEVDAEIQRLTRQIAELSISKVLGKENKPQYHQDKPVLTYTIVLSSGDRQIYVFSAPEEKGDYVLKPSHREEYFKVKKWVVDDIMAYDRSKLVQKRDAGNTSKKDETSKEKEISDGSL